MMEAKVCLSSCLFISQLVSLCVCLSPALTVFIFLVKSISLEFDSGEAMVDAGSESLSVYMYVYLFIYHRL